MEPDVIDELEQRLRDARPRAGRVADDAFDAELLRNVLALPIAPRRAVPRVVALPVAAGVALTATAAVMLASGPGDVGTPAAAAAVTQALRWLNPPPGTILHARSVESQGGLTKTLEVWQSADRPRSERLRTEGPQTYETSEEGLYDPAVDTIYTAIALGPDGAPPDSADQAKAKRRARPAGEPPDGPPPAGDPIVTKVRMLLQDGRMTVTGPTVHDGVEAWTIALNPDAGRPVWKLWVSAADGRPLELRDPGRDASEAPQVIRWPTYEVLSDTRADQVLTLTGAHPSARVVNDPAAAEAAAARLMSHTP